MSLRIRKVLKIRVSHRAFLRIAEIILAIKILANPNNTDSRKIENEEGIIGSHALRHIINDNGPSTSSNANTNVSVIMKTTRRMVSL